MMAEQVKKASRTIAQNKKAWHDYFIDEKFEAGIELFGTEVKSLRAGRVNLKDSYCSVQNGELFALGVHIHGNDNVLVSDRHLVICHNFRLPCSGVLG